MLIPNILFDNFRRYFAANRTNKETYNPKPAIPSILTMAAGVGDAAFD